MNVRAGALRQIIGCSARWLGVEFNGAAEKVRPLVTWYLLTENHTHQAIFLGNSSDRIGSPQGTPSYFLTGAKHLWQLPLSVYASANYSEWGDELNFPFGGASICRGISRSVQRMMAIARI